MLASSRDSETDVDDGLAPVGCRTLRPSALESLPQANIAPRIGARTEREELNQSVTKGWNTVETHKTTTTNNGDNSDMGARLRI